MTDDVRHRHIGQPRLTAHRRRLSIEVPGNHGSPNHAALAAADTTQRRLNGQGCAGSSATLHATQNPAPRPSPKPGPAAHPDFAETRPR
ncbi:MAG: hypothetical protein ACRD0H_17775, partial [Actinomycetes bacterium]